jgi:hypothetical protein
MMPQAVQNQVISDSVSSPFRTLPHRHSGSS